MSSAPRSAGTESVSQFRQELSKLLPAEATDLRARALDVLVDGETHTLADIASRLGVGLPELLRALRLPARTSPEQTIRVSVEDEPPPPPAAATKRTRSAKR